MGKQLQMLCVQRQVERRCVRKKKKGKRTIDRCDSEALAICYPKQLVHFHIQPLRITSSVPPSWKSQMMLRGRYLLLYECVFNKYQNKVYKILFWVLLLSYPSTSTRALRIFQCEPIGDHYYLARDYTQKCFVGVWWFWQTWSIVCVVLYVVGIPALFFALLYRASHMHVSERLQECEE